MSNRRATQQTSLDEIASPIEAKLVVVAGPDEGLEAPLNGTISVGTDAENDLILQDPIVSRRHASFSVVGERIRVQDRQSRNGTFLGGSRITDAEVPIGAVINLASMEGTAIAIHPRWHVREVRPSQRRSFGELMGTSLAMREIFAILERVAPTDVGVLIEGETGTGKEVVARSIHRASRRASRPYVVFDCGSVPRELAESELFGHRRGAFSGAVSDRAGAFQNANGGTICLDEIGELPLELQPKLLRVLETGEVRAVGDDIVRTVDVRVLASTNRDLQAEAQRRTFRSDLLYRLEVVKVRVPPLRHRPEDVPALAAYFLHEKIDPADPIAGPNLQRLVSYAWPGNVRELRNRLQRAVALAHRGDPPRFNDLVLNLGPSTGSPITLGLSYPGVATHMPFKEAKEQLLANFEQAYVEALLERFDGNITKAASAAGLSRKHLHKLVQATRGSGDSSETTLAKTKG